MRAVGMHGFQVPGSSPDKALATILWRGKYLILVSVAVALILGAVVTAVTDETYEARGLLQVSSLSDDPLSAQLVGQELAKIYAELLGDRSFLEEVVSRAPEGTPVPADLRDRIAARALSDTSLVELTVEASSPEAAAQLAGELATAFVSTISETARVRSERLRGELEASIADLDGQIQQLAASAEAETDSTVPEQLDSLRTARAALTSQLARVISRDLGAGSGVILTAPPTASSSPVRPRPALIFGGAVLAGLLVGFALAWLRAQLDGRIYSAREVEEIAGTTVLATIPSERQSARRRAGRGADGYDRLYSNLAYLSNENGSGVIAFLSYADGEATTSAVEGLGRAAARNGEQVAMVDGDLRAKRLSHAVGHGNDAGLSSAIALRRKSAGEDRNGLHSPPGPSKGTEALEHVRQLAPGLSLLAAGQTHGEVASVLRPADLEVTFSELRKSFSLVLVDSPPSGRVADASVLASAADGAVVIARVGETERDDLADLVSRLRQGRAPLVGAVVFEPRRWTLFRRRRRPAATASPAPGLGGRSGSDASSGS